MSVILPARAETDLDVMTNNFDLQSSEPAKIDSLILESDDEDKEIVDLEIYQNIVIID